MEPLAIVIGLFILVAILKNKELSGDNATQVNKDIFDYLGVFVIILILAGLGFLWKTPMATHPSMSLLLPAYIIMIPFAAFAKGPSKVIAKVATISILVFVIMGSFM